MERKIKIEEYEIGRQKNFDLLSFYNSLPDENEEEEIIKATDNDLEDYHHSLFYPILTYCINVLNSSNKEYLEKMKFKIGIDAYLKIYVSVGRQMYDLFFTEGEDSINNYNINFDSGKDKFNLRSVSSVSIIKDSSIIDSYKEFFDIPIKETKKDTKKLIFGQADHLEISVDQLIETKKKNIVSKFLKGYSHQEGVLKSFEEKISGQFMNMPNLIFKRSNDDGKTIEELDQIYLLTLKNKKDKMQINGFDVFYYVDYSKTKEEKIIVEGKPLELINNNLYFVEIKKSSAGLKKSFQKVEKKQVIEENSKSTNYKREYLTDVGNTILTANIFAKLIENISKKTFQMNILYIVDDEFNLDMVLDFQKCLEHDDIIIIKNEFHIKIYLIYTQPDLAFQHFIEENQHFIEEKKENEKTIKSLKEEMELMIQNHEKKIKFLQNRFSYSLKYCHIDKEVIDFCTKIENSKNLISIGTYDTINENHKYKFTSLNNVTNFSEKDLQNNYFLIDLSTFNYVKFDNINNSFFVENSLEIYKENMPLCLYFDEAYILVDFIFMKYFRDIIGEKILEKYAINIYMFENYFFMIYLKKDSNLIFHEIKIFKNMCMNPMLDKESENLELDNVDEFIENYYNLILLRDFFIKKVEQIQYKSTYLFDFKSKINYIIKLCVKPGENNENKKNNSDCYVQLMSVKSIYNNFYDNYTDEFIKNFNYRKIIFVRKTEFGIRFEQSRIESIIKYLFGIKDFIIEDKIKTEEKKIKIDKEDVNEIHKQITIKKDNHFLHFYILSDLEIEPRKIPLIEYHYFISLPLLLKKKANKPNVLILSNDFGLLNYYFTTLYQDLFNISSFMEYTGNITGNNFKINNDNIKISKFTDVIEIAHKKNNSNLKNYDLILIEFFEKREEKDVTIPSYDILSKVKKILNYDGIVAFNLRSETIKIYNDSIKSLKDKHYKNVNNIYLRPCSGFIICSQDKNVKLEKNYLPNGFYFYEEVINKYRTLNTNC